MVAATFCPELLCNSLCSNKIYKRYYVGCSVKSVGFRSSCPCNVWARVQGKHVQAESDGSGMSTAQTRDNQ